MKKQVEGPGGFSPAGGWTFTVPGSTQGTGVTAAGTGVTPAFDVTPGSVTITETQQSGYAIVPQSGRNASCTKNGAAVPANQITDTANGVSLSVGALDIVACEFRNTPTKATVKVRKQTTGGVGGAFTIQRSGNGAGTQNLNFTTTAGSNPTAFQSMSLFPGSYTLTETVIPGGWAFDTADCGTVNAGTKSTTLQVTAGQTVECTVTNKSTAGTIELAKTWSGALDGRRPDREPPDRFEQRRHQRRQLAGDRSVRGQHRCEERHAGHVLRAGERPVEWLGADRAHVLDEQRCAGDLRAGERRRRPGRWFGRVHGDEHAPEGHRRVEEGVVGWRRR